MCLEVFDAPKTMAVREAIGNLSRYFIGHSYIIDWLTLESSASIRFAGSAWYEVLSDVRVRSVLIGGSLVPLEPQHFSDGAFLDVPAVVLCSIAIWKAMNAAANVPEYRPTGSAAVLVPSSSKAGRSAGGLKLRKIFKARTRQIFKGLDNGYQVFNIVKDAYVLGILTIEKRAALSML